MALETDFGCQSPIRVCGGLGNRGFRCRDNKRAAYYFGIYGYGHCNIRSLGLSGPWNKETHANVLEADKHGLVVPVHCVGWRACEPSACRFQLTPRAPRPYKSLPRAFDRDLDGSDGMLYVSCKGIETGRETEIVNN